MAHGEMMSDWGRHASLHSRAESSCPHNVMSFVRSNRQYNYIVKELNAHRLEYSKPAPDLVANHWPQNLRQLGDVRFTHR